MDLNGEAVEIARLSCWIKTAETGKELTAWTTTSCRATASSPEPSPLEAWRAAVPGRVRGRRLRRGDRQPALRPAGVDQGRQAVPARSTTGPIDGMADLYVYFYELGLNLLKPGGRLGFIVTNKWMKAGYGEPLRSSTANRRGSSRWSISGTPSRSSPTPTCSRRSSSPASPTADPPPETARVCVIPREQTADRRPVAADRGGRRRRCRGHGSARSRGTWNRPASRS